MHLSHSKAMSYLCLIICGLGIRLPQLMTGHALENNTWKYINSDASNAAKQISSGNFAPFTETGPMHSLVLIHGMNGNFGTYLSGLVYKLSPSVLMFQLFGTLLWILLSGVIADITLEMCNLHRKQDKWLIILIPMIELIMSSVLTIPLSVILFTPLLIGLWYRYYTNPKWQMVPIEFGTVIGLMLQANFRESLPFMVPFIIIIPIHWLCNGNKWNNLADIMDTGIMIVWLTVNLWGSMYEANNHNILYENRNSWQNPVSIKFIVVFYICAAIVLFFASLIWHNLNKFEHKVIRFSIYLDILSIPGLPWTKLENIPKLGEFFSYNDILMLAIWVNIFIIALLISTNDFIPMIAKLVGTALCLMFCISLAGNVLNSYKSNHEVATSSSVSMRNLEDVPINDDYHNLHELKREYARHFVEHHKDYTVTPQTGHQDEQFISVRVRHKCNVYLPILKYEHTKYSGNAVLSSHIYRYSELKAPTVYLQPGHYDYSANYQPDISSVGAVIFGILTWLITILCWIGIEIKYLVSVHQGRKEYARKEQLRLNYNMN